MSESIVGYNELTKEEKYQRLIPQIKSLIEQELDLIANLANICAALKEVFNFWWVGFYIVKENELVLGPFQGPIACTRIALGRGVCGTSWKNKETIIVADVDLFPGHISCSIYSKSEIVIPIIRNKEVWGVLDIDSNYLNHFDKVDENYLVEIMEMITIK